MIMNFRKRLTALAGAAALVAGCVGGGGGMPQPLPPAAAGPAATFADLAAYAEASDIAVVAVVDKAIAIDPARAPGLAPGMARVYVEATTASLLAGDAPIGESLTYLVDLARNADGDIPKIKGSEVLLFARTPPGSAPGALQLVAPDAQLPADPALLQRTRDLYAELYAPDAPPRVTGIRDALSVAGNLAGESETQLFVRSASGDPVTITVLRRPGAPPAWGVSWSDIVDQSATAPARDTLEWYRLACFLPAALPADALLSGTPTDRQRAAADYRFVRDSLGECARNRT